MITPDPIEHTELKTGQIRIEFGKKIQVPTATKQPERRVSFHTSVDEHKPRPMTANPTKKELNRITAHAIPIIKQVIQDQRTQESSQKMPQFYGYETKEEILSLLGDFHGHAGLPPKREMPIKNDFDQDYECVEENPSLYMRKSAKNIQAEPPNRAYLKLI